MKSAYLFRLYAGMSSGVELLPRGERLSGRGGERDGERGRGRQSEKESGAFCETLAWIRRAAWRFSPLSGNLDPVRAQKWLEEGKTDYGVDESGRWPKA